MTNFAVFALLGLKKFNQIYIFIHESLVKAKRAHVKNQLYGGKLMKFQGSLRNLHNYIRPRLKHVIFQEIGTLPHITYWQIGDDPASFDEFFSGHKTLYLTLSKYQGTTCKMKIIVIRKVEKLVYDDFAINLINFFPGDFTKK